PGNSGGPVIIKPEMSAVGETKPIDSASLIGVVAGYVPYADVAISRQTERPRIIFEENSGLAIVYPVDLIQEAISQHEAILNEAPAAEGGSHGSSNDDGAPGVEVRLEAGRPA